MVFYHNINPVLLTIGPFSIRYYGLVYALSFLLFYYLLKKMQKTGFRIKNLTDENIDSFLLYLITGTILGGRIGYFLFYNIKNLFSTEIFKIWHGGMSFHGAVLGMGLATYLFCRKNSISFYEIADFSVIPATLALSIGRLANFANGELVGKPVPENSFFSTHCIDYTKNSYLQNPPAGCRYPSQLFESIKNLLLFSILLPLYLKKKNKLKEGTVFWLFIFLYGILRFLVHIYRAPDPQDPLLLGLSIGQYLSLAMVLTAIPFLYKRLIHRRFKKLKQDEESLKERRKA